MDMDFHNGRQRYSRAVQKITAMPDSRGREILLKYIRYHESILERKQMAYTSALRSIEIAKDIVKWKNALSERPYSLDAIKAWWQDILKRKTITHNELMSTGGLHKFQTQGVKFLKFLEFLESGDDMVFFNTRKQENPKAGKYLIYDESKKQKEVPRIDPKKFKELIDYLLARPNYYGKLAGVMAAYFYDTGNRFGEGASLRNSSLQYEGDFILANIQDSKTNTRTNVCILSRDHIISWQRLSPNRGKKDGYLFCSRNGGHVPYDKVCWELKGAAKELGFSFLKQHLWHSLRHDFASRAYEMPGHLIDYYMGWSGRGMRSHYSQYNYKACLPYLIKMNEGHPMLNYPLSYLDEQKEEVFQSRLESMIDERVRQYLEKKGRTLK